MLISNGLINFLPPRTVTASSLPMDIEASTPPSANPSVPAPSSSEAPHRGVLAKALFSLLIIIVGAVSGYLVVYFWILNDVGSTLNASVLKGQVISNQEAKSVKEQLINLGFSVPENDFHALDTPSSTSYKSNLLEGNELEKTEAQEKKEKGFYFRNEEDGEAYYVQTDESGKVDPSRITPLIQE